MNHKAQRPLVFDGEAVFISEVRDPSIVLRLNGRYGVRHFSQNRFEEYCTLGQAYEAAGRPLEMAK